METAATDVKLDPDAFANFMRTGSTYPVAPLNIRTVGSMSAKDRAKRRVKQKQQKESRRKNR